MKTVRTLSGAVFRHTIPFRSSENTEGGKIDAEHQIRKEKNLG